MFRIPVIESRFVDLDEDRSQIGRRLLAHLRGLPERRLKCRKDSGEAGWADHDIPTREHKLHSMTRRTKRLLERRAAASGLSHLKLHDRERLAMLRDGAQLIRIANEYRADELAADLHAGMPWMAPATKIVWQAMRRSVRGGWPGVRLPPILLNRAPGIGKSHWARGIWATCWPHRSS